ncbi:MAG: SRPBCC family protein [Sediminibacterium sp.]
MSKVYSFKKVQQFPVSLDAAWCFFSNPSNLNEITPADMGFTTTSKYHGDQVYAGQLIEYTVRPILGIPIYWMTEITHVKEKEYFIDEQRFGPYSFWHHQHYFKEIEGGIEMTDIVHYKIPFWILGDLMNSLLVRKKLNHIFEFRKEAVDKKFGIVKQQPETVG